MQSSFQMEDPIVNNLRQFYTLSSTIFLNSHTLGCVIVKCRDIVFPATGHRPELMTVPSLATSLAGDPFVAATRGAAAEQIDTESRPT